MLKCFVNMYILSQSSSYHSSDLCPSSAAPCPPSQLNASVNCANNSAMLTWNSSPNAVSYTGKAVSADGHNVTCDAGMNLGCQLNGLHCGKEYTFTVSASDGDCQSPDSEPVIHTTGEREKHLCFLPTSFFINLFLLILVNIFLLLLSLTLPNSTYSLSLLILFLSFCFFLEGS